MQRGISPLLIVLGVLILAFGLCSGIITIFY
jgi:hypothetical protein